MPSATSVRGGDALLRAGRPWVFPRQDLSSGQNLWDVSNEFYDILKNVYGLPHPMFFCPDARPDLEDSTYNTFGSFILLGWSLWVPRNNAGAMVPPNPGDPGFLIIDPLPFRGPIKIGDQYFNSNPMLTDDVISDPSVSPNVNLAVDGAAMNTYYGWTAHRWNLRLVAINEAYADGHVKRSTWRRSPCPLHGKLLELAMRLAGSMAEHAHQNRHHHRGDVQPKHQAGRNTHKSPEMIVAFRAASRSLELPDCIKFAMREAYRHR